MPSRFRPDQRGRPLNNSPTGTRLDALFVYVTPRWRGLLLMRRSSGVVAQKEKKQKKIIKSCSALCEIEISPVPAPILSLSLFTFFASRAIIKSSPETRKRIHHLESLPPKVLCCRPRPHQNHSCRGDVWSKYLLWENVRLMEGVVRQLRVTDHGARLLCPLRCRVGRASSEKVRERRVTETLVC